MRIHALSSIVSFALCGVAQASGTFIALQTPNVQITKISANGAYAVGSNPVRFSRLTVEYRLAFTPPATGEELICVQQMSWTVDGWATGVLVFGTGQLHYTGSVAPAP